jgi:hypothetical protein
MAGALKKRPTIYVSHSGNDEFVRALRDDLPKFEVLVSDWNDATGDLVAGKIQNDLARADVVVVVLSGAAKNSKWVQQEIGLSLGRDLRIIPVFEPLDGTNDLPGLLAGLEWEPYYSSAPVVSAHRTALRISHLLEADLIKTFQTWWEYREWWFTKDERAYTNRRCYWATPHDTLSWLYPGKPRQTTYRVLIRGSLAFDLSTATFYEPYEVVYGVDDLSAFQEITVIGNLSAHTLWEPSFQRSIDEFLRNNPSAEQLMKWYRHISREPTCIEVRMSFDEARADRDVQRLEALFDARKDVAKSAVHGA